jgi:hypothetical protein
MQGKVESVGHVRCVREWVTKKRALQFSEYPALVADFNYSVQSILVKFAIFKTGMDAI